MRLRLQCLLCLMRILSFSFSTSSSTSQVLDDLSQIIYQGFRSSSILSNNNLMTVNERTEIDKLTIQLKYHLSLLFCTRVTLDKFQQSTSFVFRVKKFNELSLYVFSSIEATCQFPRVQIFCVDVHILWDKYYRDLDWRKSSRFSKEKIAYVAICWILLTDERMNCYCCLSKMNEKSSSLYRKSSSFIYLLILISWFIEIHLRIEIFVCHEDFFFWSSYFRFSLSLRSDLIKIAYSSSNSLISRRSRKSVDM
jgi:hypothetical protein